MKTISEELLNAINYDLRSFQIISSNFIVFKSLSCSSTQVQTKEAFSNKWGEVDYESIDFKKSQDHQRRWYLDLYGFNSEMDLKDYLTGLEYVLDAGAGACGKAAWFAHLSPKTKIIAVDISDSLHAAAEYYKSIKNLYFIQCDISNLKFFEDSLFDYISCDQVIHHTSNPYNVFSELIRVLKQNHDISVYVYRKKAIPRELLDDYFRDYCTNLTHEELSSLSEQLTELGRSLSECEKEFNFPNIPLLGIEGGKSTVQRFVYWNFIKCFWNPSLGYKNSKLCNYDWYSPSQAYRYSKKEFKEWITQHKLEELYFHAENACYSGRFKKNSF